MVAHCQQIVLQMSAVGCLRYVRCAVAVYNVKLTPRDSEEMQSDVVSARPEFCGRVELEPRELTSGDKHKMAIFGIVADLLDCVLSRQIKIRNIRLAKHWL